MSAQTTTLLPCLVTTGKGSRSTHNHLFATGKACNEHWVPEWSDIESGDIFTVKSLSGRSVSRIRVAEPPTVLRSGNYASVWGQRLDKNSRPIRRSRPVHLVHIEDIVAIEKG